MARAIDANELLGIERLLDTDVVRQSKTASWLLDQVLHDIQAMPTLTPPNDAPPCYQPDGDGCAYQCYDGQDEPIDKCKECPLCYSDKQRQHTPPNEPLTLDELREMDGEPVYLIVDVGYEPLEMWALIDVPEEDHVLLINNIGGRLEYYSDDDLKQDHITVYRRPPEGRNG